MGGIVVPVEGGVGFILYGNESDKKDLRLKIETFAVVR